LFVLYVAFFALLGRGTFFSSDEGQIFNTALSLVQRQSLAISPGENVHRGRDNRYYACREILPTVAALPFCTGGMLVQRLAGPAGPPVAPAGGRDNGTNWPIFVTVTLLGPAGVAVVLVLLYGFVRADGGGERLAFWLTLVAGCTTPLAVYAKTIFPQVFEAACLMLAFLAALRWRQTGSQAAGLGVGMASGLGLMSRAAFVPVALWFFVYLLFVGPAPRRTRLGVVALFLVATACGAGMTAWVNWLRWGSPFDFGYHHAQETFSTPPLVGLWGLLLSPGKGLLVYAPVLLLPPLFGRALWRRGRAEVILALAITATYLAIYCRWYDWTGGIAWGPRFLVPLIAPWTALLGRAFPAHPPAAPATGDNRAPSTKGRQAGSTKGRQAGWAGWLLAVAGLFGLAVQCLGIFLYPKWVGWTHPETFRVGNSELVKLASVLWERGPDDLWLWSGPSSGRTGLLVCVAVLVGTLLLAAAVRWHRAPTFAARLPELLLPAVPLLLLLGCLA
jgi:hypothetical protein